MQQFDTIVIGAGHNGLVCASYLAKAGQNVLVLEASASAGGLASTREFHPGFHASVAHSVNHFSEKIAQELNLASHGYAGPGAAMATVGLDVGGENVTVEGDAITGGATGESGVYAELQAQLRRFAKALAPSWLKTMPRVGNNSLKELLTFAQIGVRMRLLGRDDMRELLRVASLPSRDLMDERFDSELLKAALSWDALVGSSQAPRSPNNTILMLLYRLLGQTGGAPAIPKGGVASLIDALQGAAVAAGAEVRLNAPVRQIAIAADEDGMRATGVTLADGTELTAARVVSSADPRRTFFDLLGAEYLEIEFANRIRRLRCDGYVAKLHLALDGEPQFNGLSRADGRMIIAPTMDSLEFAYDDAKYGRLPEEPVMEVMVPTLREPTLAPDGKHVLSANVMYVPYKLRDGWDDAQREALLNKCLATLEQYAPGLGAQVLHAEMLTPADLESDWHVTGGHWHHAEFALDQMLMMRPTFGAAQYATPIPGLYLCGAGSHPGGGLMGGAGHNAAREILQ